MPEFNGEMPSELTMNAWRAHFRSIPNTPHPKGPAATFGADPNVHGWSEPPLMPDLSSPGQGMRYAWQVGGSPTRIRRPSTYGFGQLLDPTAQAANMAATAAAVATAQAKGPTLADVQTALNNMGFVGPPAPGQTIPAPLKVDNKMGPLTQAALKAFQTGHNLPVTGNPDAATLAALGFPGATGVTSASSTSGPKASLTAPRTLGSAPTLSLPQSVRVTSRLPLLIGIGLVLGVGGGLAVKKLATKKGP